MDKPGCHVCFFWPADSLWFCCFKQMSALSNLRSVLAYYFISLAGLCAERVIQGHKIPVFFTPLALFHSSCMARQAVAVLSFSFSPILSNLNR